MPAYGCRFCGQVFMETNAARDHAIKEHGKEIARLRIEKLKEGAESVEAHLIVAEAIKEYTLKYLSNETDSQGMYSIDEALGGAALHQLFVNAESCGYKGCRHGEPDPDLVTQALATQPRP